MSLGVRVCKSRTVALLSTSDEGMLMADPAIDLEASDVHAYYKSLFDIENLVFKSGQEPTLWTIKGPSKGQKDHGASIKNPRLCKEWYIRCGLLAHNIWTIEDDDGVVIPGAQPGQKEIGGILQEATEAWYEGMQFPDGIASALYQMIAWLSEAQRPLSKPSDPPSGGAK